MTDTSRTDQSRSVPAGGSATINGVLYQLFWSLLRASRVRLESVYRDDSGDFEQVTLTMEPAGGGGDLVVAEGAERVIEQLKARPDGSTWSLREFVEGVIPDLYIGCLGSEVRSTFRFITEGRIGQWESVYKFFQSLRGRTCPEDDPLSGLDSEMTLPFGGHRRAGDGNAFWNESSYTEASLFERIVVEVRKRRAVSEREEESATRRMLWYVLGNFEFVGGQDAQLLQQEIDSHLLAVVDQSDEIPRIRDAMAVDLARRAADGGNEIEVYEFFREHNLNAISLSDWARLRLGAASHIDSFVTRHGYDADFDVRGADAITALDDWPITKPILAITGQSGQGKSWRAYRMAIEARTSPQIVLIVDAAGNAESTLSRAARSLWQEIAGHDIEIPISRIADRVRRVIGTQNHPWMLLVIDGVQETVEATALVQQPWEEWGVRVLMTCHPQLTERIEQDSLGRCMIATVDDFSVDELHEYLRRCFGDDWPVIPDTVWGPLRRPLLANLYRSVATDPDWRPETEYELYAKSWRRLESLDGVLLKRLVRPLLEGGGYPWSDQQVADAGIDTETLHRIERTGWLHRLQGAVGPRFEIAHDRLLNWLVAATLVDQFREQSETIENLGKRLRAFLSHQDSVGNRNMGFVPMDFLWIGLRDDLVKAHVPNLLAELEHHPIRTDVLYERSIPTLGASAVEALVSRLKATIKNRLLSRQVTHAIGLIGGSAAADASRELLISDEPQFQRAAMRILSHCPDERLLDRLWELHIEGQNDPSRFLREHEGKHSLYEDSFGALRETCRAYPDWLNEAIKRSNPQIEPTHSLAYLVARVGGEVGKAIWHRNKQILRDKVQQSKERSLVTCIGRYADREEIEWLCDNISRDDEMVGPMAMKVLAQLAPELAVEHLDSLERQRLSTTGHWYAAHLFAQASDAVKAKLLAMMRGASDPWKIAAVYKGHEHHLDAATLCLLLDDLEERLQSAVSIEEWGQSEPLYSEFRLLASLGTLEQLNEFNKRSDSRLESLLVEFLLRIGPRRGLSTDSLVRDDAVEVLYRFGGSGFTVVVNEFLQADSRFGRMDAIRLSAKRPNDDTIRRLAGLTEGDNSSDEQWIEQCDAAESLADNESWHPVLCLVERLGLRTDRDITDYARRGRRPPAELICETRERVKTMTIDSSPGELYVLGIGGQEEDASTLHNILAQCEPESDVAEACAIALELMQDESEEAVELLRAQLDYHEFSATNALIANGSQAALQSLRDHAHGLFDLAIAINTINRLNDNQDEIIAIRDALDVERQERGWYDFNTKLDCLLSRITDPDVIDVLMGSDSIQSHVREASFASEGPHWFTGSKAAAIRCLAKFDLFAAFLAAKTALHNVDWHDRDHYPYILMQLNQEMAIPILLQQLHVEEDTKVLRAICGALMADDIDSRLRQSLSSSDSRERDAACVAAGEVSVENATEERLHKLLHDTDEAVSRSAADAINHIEVRKRCRELGKAILEESDKSRRWLLLDCLISLADPGDKHRTWPVEGAHIGDVLSPLQIKHVKRRLERLRDEINR